MISSPDNLTVGTYFNIICSDPIDLRPLGRGTDGQRMKAWMKIREEDNKINPMHSDTNEMYEEHDFLVLRSAKLHLCHIVLTKRDSDNCRKVLEEFGITGDRKDMILRVADMWKGTQRQIEEIRKTLKDRPRITKADCLRELAMVNKHFPINLRSSLSEYRGAQANYIELINSMKRGNSDNQ